MSLGSSELARMCVKLLREKVSRSWRRSSPLTLGGGGGQAMGFTYVHEGGVCEQVVWDLNLTSVCYRYEEDGWCEGGVNS